MKGLNVPLSDKLKWLSTREPEWARLFCPKCVRYLGASRKTCPDCPEENFDE